MLTKITKCLSLIINTSQSYWMQTNFSGGKKIGGWR